MPKQPQSSGTIIRWIIGLLIAVITAGINSTPPAPINNLRGTDIAQTASPEAATDVRKPSPSIPIAATSELPEPPSTTRLPTPTENLVRSIAETGSPSLDSQIADQARELNKVNRQIEQTNLQISKAKEKLSKAQFDQRTLPDQINRLKESIARLDTELSSAAEVARLTKTELAEFHSTVPARKQRVQQNAISVRDAKYDAAVGKLLHDQKERNEFRSKIGAQQHDQEEALWLRREKQKSKLASDAAYLAVIDRESAAIVAETDVLSRKITAAEEAYQRHSDARRISTRELAAAESALVAAPIEIAALPAELTRSEAELNRLMSLKDSLDAQLKIARREQLERNRELVSARASEPKVRSQPKATSPRIPIARWPNNYWSNLQFSKRIPNTPQGRHDWYMLRSGFDVLATSSSSVAPKPVYVHSYYRKDGTYVRSHWRSNPSW